MEKYIQGEYWLKQLTVDDWQLLRDMRLYALKTAPGVYGSNYATEIKRPDENWKERLSDSKFGYWGLFLRDEMIGMTGILRYENHTTKAILISSFIEPAHRRTGLSALFYKARIDWAKANGYETLIVSHRADNLASKAANQQAGFSFTHTQKHLWPDGAEVDEVFYKLDI